MSLSKAHYLHLVKSKSRTLSGESARISNDKLRFWNLNQGLAFHPTLARSVYTTLLTSVAMRFKLASAPELITKVQSETKIWVWRQLLLRIMNPWISTSKPRYLAKLMSYSLNNHNFFARLWRDRCSSTPNSQLSCLMPSNLQSCLSCLTLCRRWQPSY